MLLILSFVSRHLISLLASLISCGFQCFRFPVLNFISSFFYLLCFPPPLPPIDLFSCFYTCFLTSFSVSCCFPFHCSSFIYTPFPCVFFICHFFTKTFLSFFFFSVNIKIHMLYCMLSLSFLSINLFIPLYVFLSFNSVFSQKKLQLFLPSEYKNRVCT